MLERVSKGPRRVRTLFLSDIHLGTRGCQADKLLDFLRYYEADTVYLVGDIVDGWQLRAAWYWPQTHNDVVQKLLRQARKGARLRLYPRQPRRVPARLLRHAFRRHRSGRGRHACRSDRQTLPRHSRGPFRRRDPPCALARAPGQYGVRFRNLAQHSFQCDPTRSRADLLVALAMGQAEGQECRQFHRRVRAHARGRGAAARRRRRDLRSHPSRGDPQRARLFLHQLRRLGRKLHRGGRALRRKIRDREMGGTRAAARRACGGAGLGVPAGECRAGVAIGTGQRSGLLLPASSGEDRLLSMRSKPAAAE